MDASKPRAVTDHPMPLSPSRMFHYCDSRSPMLVTERAARRHQALTTAAMTECPTAMGPPAFTKKGPGSRHSLESSLSRAVTLLSLCSQQSLPAGVLLSRVSALWSFCPLESLRYGVFTLWSLHVMGSSRYGPPPDFTL